MRMLFVNPSPEWSPSADANGGAFKVNGFLVNRRGSCAGRMPNLSESRPIENSVVISLSPLYTFTTHNTSAIATHPPSAIPLRKPLPSISVPYRSMLWTQRTSDEYVLTFSYSKKNPYLTYGSYLSDLVFTLNKH
jgi:hypothetical protein